MSFEPALPAQAHFQIVHYVAPQRLTSRVNKANVPQHRWLEIAR